MNLRIVILFSIVLVSCKQKCNQSYYWVRNRNQEIAKDTISFCQSILQRNDSIILTCKMKIYTDSFIFNKNDKRCAFYSGMPGTKAAYIDGKLFKMASKTKFTYVADTSVVVNSKTFSIFKYYTEVEHTHDADFYYYWVPDIGIVYFYSTAWGNSCQLFTNDAQLDASISKIISVIKQW